MTGNHKTNICSNQLIRLTLATLLFGTSLTLSAQDNRGQFAVEFDPITTSLGARNLLLYYEPNALEHWTFSGIVFAADFPDWVDDLMSYRNRDKNFESKIAPSLGAGTDYFFNRNKEGAHLGVILFLWNYEVSRNAQKAEFSNLEILPRVGYRYFPFSGVDLFLDAFAGLQFEIRAGGNNSLDGEEVEPTPILPFMTVHLGYHF